jgi:hypothetical protein
MVPAAATAPAAAINFATTAGRNLRCGRVSNCVFSLKAELEAYMTYKTARSLRIGFVTLIAAALTAGISGGAIAKAHKRHLHAHHFLSESRAQPVPQQPVRLGAMRYYGGPKSPMWRGPVEN